jgi:hypothetical protein
MNVQEGAYRPRLPQFLKGQKRRRSDGPDREQAECQGQSAEFEAESHGSLLTMPLTGPYGPVNKSSDASCCFYTSTGQSRLKI